jgi:hypothetical protein
MEPDKDLEEPKNIRDAIRLTTKWADDSVDGEIKSVVKPPMTEEEEADEIIRRLKTPPKPDPLAGLRNVILPMIRRVTPGTIAQEIIGVQPMTGPIADIKTMRHIFSDPRKEDSADTGTGS